MSLRPPCRHASRQRSSGTRGNVRSGSRARSSTTTPGLYASTMWGYEELLVRGFRAAFEARRDPNEVHLAVVERQLAPRALLATAIAASFGSLGRLALVASSMPPMSPTGRRGAARLTARGAQPAPGRQELGPRANRTLTTNRRGSRLKRAWIAVGLCLPSSRGAAVAARSRRSKPAAWLFRNVQSVHETFTVPPARPRYGELAGRHRVSLKNDKTTGPAAHVDYRLLEPDPRHHQAVPGLAP